MKKKWKRHVLPRGKYMQILRMTRLCALLIVVGLTNTFGTVKSQNLTFDIRDVSLKKVFQMIEKQSDYRFLYRSDEVADIRVKQLKVSNGQLEDILGSCLQGTSLEYETDGSLIIVKRSVLPVLPQHVVKITGQVTDQEGNALPGVTVRIKGASLGMATDTDGKFTMEVPDPDVVLVFSFVGMETLEVKYAGQKMLHVELKDETKEIDEVVVTGIFQRKASSFTGSAVSMSKDELMKVSNQNLFQSLKNMDPSLMIFDNLEFGSDPNKMPDMQLRGTSAFNLGETATDLKGNYMNNPNLPLFILDGFEASVEKIFDLDMNRVESVTILKDAAAKAIYGSKAANGVVVVETQRLTSGQLRVAYNGSVNVSVPDLSSYDLCKAAEKLRLEKDYGLYDSDDYATWLVLQQQYNKRLAAVLSGVETDWKAKPLRTGIGHKHTLSFELGDQDLRLIASISYNDVVGVMKGSDRKNIAGSVSISYRHRKFNFRDVLSVTANNSSDSPYGLFSEYTKMNPYWSPADEFGNVVKNAEISWSKYGTNDFYANPLYNVQLNTRLTTEYIDVTNNFYTEWNVLQGLKATVRFGITRKVNSADEYYPANHLKFEQYPAEDFFRKGSYQMNEGTFKALSGDFNINFSKQIAEKHYLFGNLGYSLSENSYEEDIYQAEGFPSDKMDNIMFARQYAKDSKPSGYEQTTRDMGFLGVVNYSYDDRLLFDGTLRFNASSQFGKDHRWGTFWSIGTGWNMHNEKFMKDNGLFEQLKLRASVGYTGSQSSDAYQSIATYNYFLDKTYDGFVAASLAGMENRGLKWQQKLDYNVGMDLNFKRKLQLRFDYYLSVTENSLVNLTLPTSTGFRSVTENVGRIKNNGVEAKVTWTAFSRPESRTYITVNGTIAHNKNKLVEISDALKKYNEEQDKIAGDRFNSRPVTKYYEGMSMNALWAVPSLGIDPANGREIYVDRNGKHTYVYDPADQVVCGNALPKISGNFGASVEYKGWGLNLVFSYQYGAQMYNTTLVERVENVDMNYNVDRRVIDGRWRKSGDVKPYKSLNRVWVPEEGTYKMEKTQPTSRFIQDRNELDLASANLSYDFYRFDFLRKVGLERLKLTFYMNDVFTLSSIKVERGTSYPFARSFNFSLQAVF